MRAILYISILIFMGSIGWTAENPPPRTVKKGFEITVNSYDPKTGMFLFSIQGEGAVGPNYARSEDLRKAIGYEGSKQDFDKQRPQMNGSIYSLKNDLRVYELSDVAQMVKKKGTSSPRR
jgi:hypothetical protein